MHPRPGGIVSEYYVAPHFMHFTVSANTLSLSGLGYTVSDPHGNLLFKTQGRFLTLRDSCTLLDARGNPIFTARRKLLSMHDRWQVAIGGHFQDHGIIFSVKRSSILQFKTRLNVYFKGNESEKVPDFQVKCNFFETQAKIFYKGQLVAEITQMFTAAGFFLDRKTFNVLVYPNVDHAFIVILIVILDRINHKSKDNMRKSR